MNRVVSFILLASTWVSNTQNHTKTVRKDTAHLMMHYYRRRRSINICALVPGYSIGCTGGLVEFIVFVGNILFK